MTTIKITSAAIEITKDKLRELGITCPKKASLNALIALVRKTEPDWEDPTETVKTMRAREAEKQAREAAEQAFIAEQINEVARAVAKSCYALGSSANSYKPQPGALEVFAEEIAERGVVVRFVTADGQPPLAGLPTIGAPRSGFFAYAGSLDSLFRYIMAHPGTGFNEVVLRGSGRKLFFDVDGLAMDDPRVYADLIREAVMEVLEVPRECDTYAYDLYTSDTEAKGFHMLFGNRIPFTARVIQRIYKGVRAILQTKAEAGCEYSAKLLEGSVLDPAPSNDQFNMRMLGSFKVTQTEGARTLQQRQKLLEGSDTRADSTSAWCVDQEADVFYRSIITASKHNPIDDLEHMDMPEEEKEEQEIMTTTEGQIMGFLAKTKHFKDWTVEAIEKHGYKLQPPVGHAPGHNCPLCKRRHDKVHVWAVGAGLYTKDKAIRIICQRAPRGQRIIETIDQRTYLDPQPTSINAAFSRYLMDNAIQREGGVWWKQVKSSMAYFQDLTLEKVSATSCSCCETKSPTEYEPCAHATTNHLYATGRGLTCPSSAVKLRCRYGPSGANTVRVFAGLSSAVEPDTLPVPQAPGPLPHLTYHFTTEGFRGVMNVSSLKDFLAPQTDKHVETAQTAHKLSKKAAGAAVRVCRAQFIEYALQQQTYEQQLIEWEKAVAKRAEAKESGIVSDFSRIRAAIQTLAVVGVDMDKYGARTFGFLDRDTYEDEVDLLSAIHANLWVSGMDGQATFKGDWRTYNFSCTTNIHYRNSCYYRIKDMPEAYSGPKFWEAIGRVYMRAALPTFAPLPANRKRISMIGDELNSYGGRAITGLEQYRDSTKYAEHIMAFQELFENQIASEGPIFVEYALNWFAWAAQRPDTKSGVALLIHGPQGSGKSMLLSLMNKIIPHAGYCANTGVSTLTNKFNSDLDRKTLYMIAEAPERLSSDRVANATLKGLITDELMMVENKGKDIRQVNQYLNIVLASNMINCIETSEGDRRWCLMYNPEPTYSFGDSDYFAGMWKLVGDKSFQANVQEYLYTRDITGFRPEDYPKSPALRATKLTSPLVDFALHTRNLAEQLRERIQGVERPFVLRDIVDLYLDTQVILHTNRQKLESELYNALMNGSGLRDHFQIHPNATDDRMILNGVCYTNPIVFREEAQPRAANGLSAAQTQAILAAMAAMAAAGLDTSLLAQAFPAANGDAYEALSLQQLMDMAKQRKLAGLRRLPKAKVIELLRADDGKKQ